MSKLMEKDGQSIFESIKKINEYGAEYWSARDLAKVLDYKDFRNFETAIEKAKKSCETSDHNVSDHFVEATKMVQLGSNSEREVKDYHLSRYACYLLIQNADPSKSMVALGQTYFAVQTRKQELQEEFELMDEEKKRLAIRNELKEHNKKLVDAANSAGVKSNMEYAIFQNHGYQGLYGGLNAKDIHERKQLKKSQKILDHMGSTELAANLFRATQTEEKLKRDKVKGKHNANKTHFEVGKKVRDTIEELGGTMPEDLPVLEDIKKVEKKHKKLTRNT
ncbi:DNA damage-inducible protein D [Natronincola ferrireducens]|uniref:DNA-damage-inducible protein D n=1 Tax=Natronincola ferrireducens TaxID=393762 RepID=A0A1G9I1K1_9FIRM|nr:DNA damage-inducible protein D [Natronincola ferrireducens]SDL19127.1 DNA-damage-inducible protein D [Natronincola ferrireducens]